MSTIPPPIYTATKEPQCDFCSELNPTWRHMAVSFNMAMVKPQFGLIAESENDWSACDICHELIVTNNRQALAERSAKNLGHSAYTASCYAIQSMFFDHYTGMYERITRK